MFHRLPSTHLDSFEFTFPPVPFQYRHCFSLLVLFLAQSPHSDAQTPLGPALLSGALLGPPPHTHSSSPTPRASATAGRPRPNTQISHPPLPLPPAPPASAAPGTPAPPHPTAPRPRPPYHTCCRRHGWQGEWRAAGESGGLHEPVGQPASGDQGGAYTTPSGDATAEATTAVSASRAGQQLPPGPAPGAHRAAAAAAPQVPLGRARSLRRESLPSRRPAPPAPSPRRPWPAGGGSVAPVRGRIRLRFLETPAPEGSARHYPAGNREHGGWQGTTKGSVKKGWTC